MKKGLLFLGLASMMSMMAGCTTDNTEGVNGEEGSKGLVNNPNLTFEMPEAPQGDDTRAMIDELGTGILWEAKDRIAVYSEDNSAEHKVRYELIGDGNTKTGMFQYKPTSGADYAISKYPCGRKVDGKITNPTKEVYVAVYPYASPNIISPEPMAPFWARLGSQSMGYTYELGGVIPREQTYTEGSFDKSAFPMIAVFDQTTTKVQFKYMGALAKISAVGDGVKLTSVKLAANLYQGSAVDNAVNNPSGKVTINFSKLMNGSLANASTEADLWSLLTNPAAKWTSTIAGSVLNVQGLGLNLPIMLAPEEGTTIDLTSAPKSLYFGIVPRSYPAGLTATFYCEDGSQYEKNYTAASNNVPAGTVINFPKITLGSGVIPMPTIAGDVISSDVLSGVSSYEVIARIDGKDIFKKTLSNFSGKVNIKDDLAAEMKSLVDNADAGDVSVNFVIRVVYTDKTNASAAISKPVSYSVTIPSPTPNLSLQFTGGKSYKMSCANQSKFTDLMYAHKSGTLTLDDIKDIDYIAFSADDKLYGKTLTFFSGINTVAIKGTCKFTGKIMYAISQTEIKALNPAFNLKYGYEFGTGFITVEPVAGMQAYMSEFAPTTKDIYWKEGLDQDMTDLTSATHVVGSEEIAPDQVDGRIYFDLVSDKLDGKKDYTFVLVLGSANYPSESKTQQSQGNYVGKK